MRRRNTVLCSAELTCCCTDIYACGFCLRYLNGEHPFSIPRKENKVEQCVILLHKWVWFRLGIDTLLKKQHHVCSCSLWIRYQFSKSYWLYFQHRLVDTALEGKQNKLVLCVTNGKKCIKTGQISLFQSRHEIQHGNNPKQLKQQEEQFPTLCHILVWP